MRIDTLAQNQSISLWTRAHECFPLFQTNPPHDQSFQRVSMSVIAASHITVWIMRMHSFINTPPVINHRSKRLNVIYNMQFKWYVCLHPRKTNKTSIKYATCNAAQSQKLDCATSDKTTNTQWPNTRGMKTEPMSIYVIKSFIHFAPPTAVPTRSNFCRPKKTHHESNFRRGSVSKSIHTFSSTPVSVKNSSRPSVNRKLAPEKVAQRAHSARFGVLVNP